VAGLLLRIIRFVESRRMGWKSEERANGKEEKYIQRFWEENLKEGDYLRTQNTIILKLKLKD
jgi:hypothetical protein